VKEARFNRKKYGGAMRQVGILGAAALYALDHQRGRLVEDHAHAALLGETIRGLAGVAIDHPVQTNIVIVEVAGLGRTAGEVADELRAEGVLASPATATAVRFVTHLDVSREQVEQAARIVERVFGRLAQSGYVA
jgi:threonine aldolase